MNLRTGTPLWNLLDGTAPDYPPLQHDERCEIAIIGGGITGALLADRLCELGREVILLDKRAPTSGSTAASTSLLVYETDRHLIDLAHQYGLPAARRIFEL